MGKVVFRFDIDTHKCIRDGVPNLLNLAEIYHVKFSFFLNTGRAISRLDTVRKMIKSNTDDAAAMLTAREKLGLVDFIYCAVINPKLIHYRTSIKRLLDSQSEIGIHGGRNHALWHRNAQSWNENKIYKEVQEAVAEVKKIDTSYQQVGFASPGWNSPDDLGKILKDLRFQYYGDNYTIEGGDDIIQKKDIYLLGTNLLGMPGGVAYFEHCKAKGMKSDEIVKEFLDFVDQHAVTVVYDHPYFAGCNEEIIGILGQCIQELQERKHSIVTLQDLIEENL